MILMGLQSTLDAVRAEKLDILSLGEMLGDNSFHILKSENRESNEIITFDNSYLFTLGSLVLIFLEEEISAGMFFLTPA